MSLEAGSVLAKSRSVLHGATHAETLFVGQNPQEQYIENETPNKSTDEVFKEVKAKYVKAGLGIGGISALALILGTLKKGATFPSQALRVVGDVFGSFSAVLAPISIIRNEIENYYLLKNENQPSNDLNTENESNNNKGIFDDWREGFYRCSSLGFMPFIFEPFINPEKFGKSIFHKIATVANIPNLLFTGYAWGAGNVQALLAWGLRKREQTQAINAQKLNDTEQFKASEKRAEEFGNIYNSCKRLAVLGSVANPTMQGLRQWADSMALFTGSISAGEFFERPLLGISRLTSLFVGIPELFAKGVDSVVRVVKERENLKKALPGFLTSDKVFDSLKNVEDKLSSPGKNDSILKTIRHYAEITFHTFSPLSMFALFTPLLDEPHLNEEAQSQGGTVGFLDKVIGRYSKVLTVGFTGLYVTLGRLPQTIFQASYFGRKLIGKLSGKEATNEDLENVREKICNSTIVKGLSKFAQNTISKLVPDWYKKDENGNLVYNDEIENEDGYLNYEQIQAKYSLDQAKEKDNFKEFFKTPSKIGKIEEEAIIQDCLEYVIKDSNQGQHSITQEELNKVTNILKNKIDCLKDSSLKPKRKALPFIGAHFLAKYVFKLLDLETRIKKIDYKSSHHNMTTAYDNDEIGISFDYELLPVVARCTKGLGSTINRLFGIAA